MNPGIRGKDDEVCVCSKRPVFGACALASAALLICLWDIGTGRAAAAAAGGPQSPRLISMSARVTRSRQAYVIVRGKTAVPCALVLQYGARTVATSGSRRPGTTGELEFTWQFPAGSRNGRWLARIHCGGASRTLGAIVLSGSAPAGAATLAKLVLTAVPVDSGRQPTISGPPRLGPARVYPRAGSVIVAPAAWFGGRGVAVYSDGAPGATGRYQAVELFERFVRAQGWYHGIVDPGVAGAQAFYDTVPTSAFTRHSNGSGYVPVPGDAVVFAGLAPPGRVFGHIAIVQAVTTHSVVLAEQNASAAGSFTVTRSASRLGPDGVFLTVVGVLHARKNTHPPKTTPATGPSPPGSPGTPGTPPTIEPSTTGGFEIAFENPAGHLATDSPRAGATDLGSAMAPSTNPSITTLSTGAHMIAIQDATAHLALLSGTAVSTTPYTMAAGHSPAIAALAGGAQAVAYVNDNGNAHVDSSAVGDHNAEFDAPAGTDPSVAAVAGGYLFAAQFETPGHLIVNGINGLMTPPSFGEASMAPGASPSAAGFGDAFVVAFEGADGSLMVAQSSSQTPIDTGRAPWPGSDPSIAILADGTYEVAYQAADGQLAVYSADAGAAELAQPMAAGTNPSITATSDGSYRIAYQAANGDVATYSPAGGAADLGQPMMPGTSPSISP